MTHVTVRRGGRRGWWRRALAVLAAAIGLLFLPLPALASGAGEQIDHYTATYTLSADGSVRVDLEFTYTLGSDGGHGPYLRIPVQVATNDKAHDRLYPLSDITASSPSGAPAQVTTKMRHGVMFAYIGDPKRTVHGTQAYRVSYTQKGVINHFGDHDEFYWNVLNGWDFWILDATALVRAPKPGEAVACYAGEPGAKTQCSTATLTLAQDQKEDFALPALASLPAKPGDAAFWSSLTPTGEFFTINVAYPKGTFADSPVFTADPAERTKYVFEWDASTRAVAIGGGALLLALLVLLGRIVLGRVAGGAAGRARDMLADVPDGSPVMAALSAGVPLSGVPGASTMTAPAPAATGTRATPPDGVRPGEVALLATGRPGPNDMAVVLADLAARGVIGLEPVTPRAPAAGESIEAQIARAVAQAVRGGDWRITRRTRPAGFVPSSPVAGGPGVGSPSRAGFAPSRAEAALLAGLFTGRDETTLRSLGAREASRIDSAMKRGAIADVAAKKWFRPGFRLSQRTWIFGLLLILLWIAAMVGVGFVAPVIGLWQWFAAVGGLFAGVIILWVALRSPVPRTRAGARAFAELEQFKKYVVDGCTGVRPVMASDAGWAPYAVAFGLAAPFARVTEPIARSSSERVSTYPWWEFAGHGVRAVSMTVTPPSSGSGSGGSSGASGGSGSSGSGSAGGGGGGTGGGGW